MTIVNIRPGAQLRVASRGVTQDELDAALGAIVIGTTNLTDGSVTEAKLAANAVTTGKIADGAVGTNDLANAAVTSAKLGASSVDESKIGLEAVTTTKIQDAAVTGAKIGAGAVTETRIGTNAVTTTKIADTAVTFDKLAANSVVGTRIADSAITTAKLANGAVTTDKMAIASVSTTAIADLAVTFDKLAADAVTGTRIADGSITTTKLGDLSVTTAKIYPAAVTEAKIADLAVTFDKLAADSVAGSRIADGAITNTKLANSSVTTDKIYPAAVTESKIADTAVTFDKLAADSVVGSRIMDGAITNAKLANVAVTTDKIYPGAVTTSKIADTAVTFDKLAADSVVGSRIADEAITTDKLDAGAVTEPKIATGAVTNSKLGSMPQATIKGRVSGSGTGAPVNLLADQVLTILGLEDLDNTSDADKPVSDATQAAIDAVAQTIEDLPFSPRPGRDPRLFSWISTAGMSEAQVTAALGGTLDTFDALPLGMIAIDSQDGAEARIAGVTDGPGVFVMREAFRIESDGLYKITAKIRRRFNSSDPANDAVQIGVQGLNAFQGAIGAPMIVETMTDLTVSDGRVTHTEVIATAAAEGVTIVAPAGAVYGRLYVRFWGNEATTAVQVLTGTNVAGSAFVSPDVAALEAELDALVSEDLPARVDALEASSTTPEAGSFKTRTLADAATIGATIDLVDVLGDTTDGDGWRDTYKPVGSGPASDTVFQSTDGRWWSRATRTGSDAGLLSEADGIHVPAWFSGVDLRGYDATSAPVRMPFIRVGAAEPPDSLKFQDDGTDWWKLSRHYTTLRDHGYVPGQDIGPAFRRAIAHCTASTHCRTVVLEAPDEDFYILSSGDPLSSNYGMAVLGVTNIAIVGPGRDLCRIKRTGGTMVGGLVTQDCTGLRLEGFSIDLDASVASGHHGISNSNVFGFRTDNLGIFNTPGYGMGTQNNDTSADRIGRWLLNDTLMENIGSDGMDVKAPTVNNEQIVISTYRVKGWSLYHDSDNALDNRFVGTIRDVDIEFTDDTGNGASAINIRPNQESHFSGAAFTSYHGVQIKGTRGTGVSTNAQSGVGIAGKRVNMFGVSVRNLSTHSSSYAVGCSGSDINIYGLNVDRCYGGVAFNVSSNCTIYSPLVTRCDGEGFRASAGSAVSNRVIAPRVEGCGYGYLGATGGAMTLERPRSYNNGDLYTLHAACRVLGPAEAVKTIPYASVRLATTAYVNLLTGVANGGTIDGTTLATGDRVLVKNQASAAVTHTVRAASVQVDSALATTYAAGNHMDGVLLAVGDRILVKSQTAPAENGIYIVTAGAPTRATDADTAGEFSGMVVTATEGIDNAGKLFVCASIVTTLGTSAINFAEAGALNGVYVVQASGAAVRATDSDLWGEMANQSYYVTAGTTNAGTFQTARGHNITLGTHPFSFVAGPFANAYEPGDEDYTLLCDATAASMTIQFAHIGQDYPGRHIEVVKTDASANTVTINPLSSQLINGAATAVLTAQYEGARCKSNGVAWYKF